MSADNGDSPELTPEQIAAISGAVALDAELQQGQAPPEVLAPGQLPPDEARAAAVGAWRDTLAPVIAGTARLLAPGWGLHESTPDVGALAEVWAPVAHKWMPESISNTIERVMAKYALEYTALTVTLAILKTYKDKPLQAPPETPRGTIHDDGAPPV